MSKSQILTKEIKKEELSQRVINSLTLNGVYTIGDLIAYNEKQLMSFRNFSKISLNEVINLLNHYNLKLGYRLVYDDCLKKPETTSNSENAFDNEADLVNSEDPQVNYTKLKNEIPLEILKINILKDWFLLSVRTTNCLKDLDIKYVGDLVQYSEYQLLRARNFGRKSLNELKIYFNEYSLIFDYQIDSSWDSVRENLIYNDKLNEINMLNNEEENKQINYSVKSSLIKDWKKLKEFCLEKKITITSNTSNLEIEKLIIEDIENILSLFRSRPKDIFKFRYGYIDEYKTLDEVGKIYQVTRERIRQVERNINSSLLSLGKIDKSSLVKYFVKYDYISFHKLFPQLDKNFRNLTRSKGTQDITRDGLAHFIENYCGVKQGFFKTPERELFNFDKFKLNEIFLSTPSGQSKDFFIEIIQDNYGYNKFVANSSIEFMKKNNLIQIVDNKIFPKNLRRSEEVAHILLDYPDGLHWKKIIEIGNNSYTSNKWNSVRLVADYSLNMNINKLIYLSNKGNHKLLKFCPSIKNREEILKIFLQEFRKIEKQETKLELIFNKMILKDEFKNLNFYDLRAIIKIFGQEKGIYFHGQSSNNTVSLNKNLQVVNIKDLIKEIILDCKNEITLDEIKSKLYENSAINAKIDELVDEMYIFRISPATFLNFNDAIKLCDKKDVKKVLDKLLGKYEFITLGFIREQTNKELGYGLSNFYYDSLSRILSKENSWFYGSNYLSNNKKKTIAADKYIKNIYDNNLSTNENYEIISKKIGISKMYFSNIVYKEEFRFNTDWIHQDD